MSNIFRKSALDKLSSPDQLDKAITIISPSFWIAATGFSAILLIALIWSVVGRIPVSVKTNGIYMNEAGIRTIVSETNGFVEEVYVADGDRVAYGQELVRIDTTENEESLKQLQKRYRDVEKVTFDSENDVATSDNKSLLDIKAQRIGADATLTADRTMLETQEKELAKQKKVTERERAAFEAAKNAYLASMNVVETSDAQVRFQDAQSDLSVSRSNYESMKNSLAQAEAQNAALDTQKEDIESEIDKLNDSGKDAQSDLEDAEKEMAAAEKAAQEAKTILDSLTENAAAEGSSDAAAEGSSGAAAEGSSDAAAEGSSDAATEGGSGDASEGSSGDAATGATAEDPAQNMTLEEAQLAYAEAQKAYEAAQTVYQAAAEKASAIESQLSGYENQLSNVRSQIRQGDTQTEMTSDRVDEWYRSMTEAQQAYIQAEDAYIAAMQLSSAQRVNNSQQGVVYNVAYQNYTNELNARRNLENNIIQLMAQVASGEANLNNQNNALKMQFNTARAGILDQINQEIKKAQDAIDKSVIKANCEGYVTGMHLVEGNAVQQGATVCRVSPEEDINQIILCYTPVTDGRKLKPGMEVMVYPSTVNRQEYGHIKAKILEVSDYVVSSEEMANRIGDSSLVQMFSQSGPVVQVSCELETDETTVSGYRWSSRKGAGIELAEGTIVEADMVTEDKAPISMVIPWLKDKLRVQRGESDSSGNG